jgi:uncharacterized protein (DUF736 family)
MLLHPAARCRHSSSRSFRAHHANLGWANLAEGRRRLDRLSATAASTFSPCRATPRTTRGPRPAFRAEDKKVLGPPSSAALRPCGLSLGCGSIAPGRSIAIAVAMGAADEKQESEMATIGSFKKSENGDYAGTVKTLTLNVKARITPVEKTNDKAPDFRIYAGRGEVEFGAAWRKTSNEGREYLSVKLDDPSFPSPIYASLVEVEGEDGLSLIWSRRNGE